MGFVVDDAIVMLENIVRHMEMGKGAARSRARRLEGSQLHDSLDDFVARLPFFCRSFSCPASSAACSTNSAVVIISAVLVSGLVSLTLTPMLCSRYLRPEHEKEHGWMYRKLENILDTSLRWYGMSLRWALRHRVLVMFFGLLILVGTAWEFWVIPKGFLPEEDTSQISVSTEANQGISFDAMKAHQEAVNRIFMADPNVVQFYLERQRFEQHRPQQRQRLPSFEGPFRASLDRQPGLRSFGCAIRPCRRRSILWSDSFARSSNIT